MRLGLQRSYSAPQQNMQVTAIVPRMFEISWKNNLRLNLSLPWPWGTTIVPFSLPLWLGERRLCASLFPNPILCPLRVAELDDGPILDRLSRTVVLRYEGLRWTDCNCCCWLLRLKSGSFLLARTPLTLVRSTVGISSPSTEMWQKCKSNSQYFWFVEFTMKTHVRCTHCMYFKLQNYTNVLKNTNKGAGIFLERGGVSNIQGSRDHI